VAGLTLDDLREHLISMGEPPYRAKQIYQSVHQRGVLDPYAMTNLPLALRERLAATLRAATAQVEAEVSADGTTKFLFALEDGRHIESVLIPEAGRSTVCVSSQVGCPMGCVFCASGVGGLIRNLTAAEIVEQVLRVRVHLAARPSHIVMMGMGEPLLNLDNVVAAIQLWTDRAGQGFSPRRITVSTAGTPVMIDRLADQGACVNLAVSLHASDDATRRALIPGSPAGRTRALVEAAARYARRTGRDATIEYVLIADENDAPEQADQLAHLTCGRHIHINLIPLNPISHRPDLRAPSGTIANRFADRLRDQGVSVTLRTQRGEDIAAACGQLALERALQDGA